MSEERESGLVVGHTYCPECNSRDNVAVYQKDGVFDATCFTPSCGKYYKQEELEAHKMLDGLLDGEGKPRFTSKKRDPITLDEALELNKKCGSLVEYRGVRPDIRKKFKHKMEFDSLGNLIRIYYPETNPDVCEEDQLKTLVGYKTRTLPKKWGIGCLGKLGKSNELSGQFLFRNMNTKYVLVVAGEEDTLAAYQMLDDAKRQKGYETIPVVSPTIGEGGAAEQLRQQYDFLDQFDHIVIGIDNDKEGREALEKIVDVLPKDKVLVAKWTYKDPSAMLQAGKHQQFVSDFYSAEPYSESGIQDSVDALVHVKDFMLADRVTLPPYMHRLQSAMRGGIRSTGAIVNIIGDTSIGKTFISDQLQYHWIYNSPIRPTTVSLERTKEELVVDMLSIEMGRNFMFMEDKQKAWDIINSRDGRDAQKRLTMTENGERRFYIIDERDGDIKSLQRQIEKAAKKYHSRMFIIDPLSDLLRSLGNEAQEDFMQWQKYLKKEGYVFINILHTKKRGTDDEGKAKKATEYDALGSSSFVQSADINIVLNRDKMARDSVERNTTYIDMPKCRGGTTGEICKLYYDPESRRQIDYDDYINNERKAASEAIQEPQGGVLEEDF